MMDREIAATITARQERTFTARAKAMGDDQLRAAYAAAVRRRSQVEAGCYRVELEDRERSRQRAACKTEAAQTGRPISICIGGAVGVSAVVTRFVHGHVVSETDKAVRVVGRAGTPCWLPRKALEPNGDWFQLARWFRADRYQERWIEANEDIGGVSA